jgi:hypothetical protein
MGWFRSAGGGGSALIKADRREQESLDYRQPSVAEAATKPILESVLRLPLTENAHRFGVKV